MQKKSVIVYVSLLLAISGLMFPNGAVLPNQRDAWTNEAGNGGDAETIETSLFGTTTQLIGTLDAPIATGDDSPATTSDPIEMSSESIATAADTTGFANDTYPPQTFEEWRNFLLAWNNMTLADLDNADPITIETLNQQAHIYEGWVNGTYTDEQKSQLLLEVHQTPEIDGYDFKPTTDQSFCYGVSVSLHVYGEHWFRVYMYLDYVKSDTDISGGNRFWDGTYEKSYGPYGYFDPYPYDTLPFLPQNDPGTSFMGSSYERIGTWHGNNDMFDGVRYYDNITGVIPGQYYFVVQMLYKGDEFLVDPPFTYRAWFFWTTSIYEVSIEDDDTTPPVIEDVTVGIFGVVMDNWPLIGVRVKATDASGILPEIFINGFPWLMSAPDEYGYCWTAIPSPRVADKWYSLEIVVWDADLDRDYDNLQSAPWVSNYYIFDNDDTPPVIEDIKTSPVDDTQSSIKIGVNATDASGIYPSIIFNWTFYDATYSNGYYWITVPSPRVPGTYIVPIFVLDYDLDWFGDQRYTLGWAICIVFDDDVEPPEVSWSTTDIQSSGDNYQLRFEVQATDARGIGAVLIQIGGYTFTDLGPHTVTLPPGRYTAYISVTDNDNDWLGDSMTTSIEVPIVLDLSPPTTELKLMPYFSDEMGCYVTFATTCSLSATDDVTGVAQTYYRINGGNWMTYTTAFNLAGYPEGAYTISYYSIDYNSNVEPFKTQTVVVDNTAPFTSLTPSGVHGLGDWFVTDVLVTLSPTDGSSGVAQTLYSYDGSNWVTYTGPFAVGREGSTTIYYYSTDNIGNVEVMKTEIVNIDWAAPETTKSLSGTVGLGDWYLSPVTVTLAAFDDYSGVGVTQYSLNGGDWNTYADPFTITSEGVSTVYFRSFDNAGNAEATKSLTLTIDTVPPTTTASLVGTKGLGDWYVSDLTVSLTAVDDTSGIATTAYRINGGAWTTYTQEFVLAADGIHYIEYNSTDEAGNIGQTESAIIRIDKTPPSTMMSLSGTMGLAGWYISDVTFTLEATDPDLGSGIARIEYSFDGTNWINYTSFLKILTEGQTTVYYRSVDMAGNTETSQSIEICIDKTPPKTGISLSGTLGLEGWYVSNVTFSLTVTGDFSGISETKYSFNGVTWSTYEHPLAISDEGLTTVYYRSIDNAGNLEETKITYIMIDKTPPTTTASLDGTQGFNDWFVSQVSVTLSATDSFSGINCTEYRVDDGSWTTYTGPFTIGKEGTTTIWYRSLDKATNTEGIGATSFKIDITPPVTTSTLQGEQGLRDWYKSDVNVTLSAADLGSGLAFTEYSLDNITWIRYETVFTISYRDITTVYYRSTDNAGNTGKAESIQVKIYIAAQTTIGPSTLNLKSNGQWVTVYIQLPEGCNANEIDVSLLELRFGDQVIHASWGEVQDGILMVKFDRAALINMLSGTQPNTQVLLEIWGQVADWIFAGTVTIRVI